MRVKSGLMMVLLVALAAGAYGERPFERAELGLRNVLPPMKDPDDPRSMFTREPGSLPLQVQPYLEHIRGEVPEYVSTGPVDAIQWTDDGVRVVRGTTVVILHSDGTVDSGAALKEAPEWMAPRVAISPEAPEVAKRFESDPPGRCNDVARVGDVLWIGTDSGLFSCASGGSPERYEAYGVDGPLATKINTLAVDRDGTLWVGTPLGISLRAADGAWSQLGGEQGLPYEDVTAFCFTGGGDLWIGTTWGAILYTPGAEGRQWYYRAGERYLPDNHVTDVAVSPDGRTVYFATENGLGRLDLVERTLREKADIIEARVNERHRRLGMVAACVLDDPYHPTDYHIPDNDNDGLWTAYHVGAMSLAYAVTGDEAAKASAKESMHALVMLQNASGTPGLVARSVVPAELGKTKDKQWRPTPDGSMYWKSDTSSDEIDGHYFAFYTYWEHIAKDDPEERELIQKQVRDLTDYIVDNGYLLLDWDGERTRWGFWSPELLNDDPTHYLENGLNSLQMLSFLKVAYYITGDDKYQKHYRDLITKHGYLDNVQLEKRVFPDENNHSDNQLGYVAWYPILQLEHDPLVRETLHKAVRRHYKTLALDRSSFFNIVTATIDPDYVDLEGAVENLQEIPTDRQNWRAENSQRADVTFDVRADRFDKRQLLRVLPCDERCFDKWNDNPYVPDEGRDGRVENDGAAYLLPYWMGRFHGFFEE